MARVKVRVVMASDFDEQCYAKPQVAEAVNTKANDTADNANGMGKPSGVWHETGKPHNPAKSGGVWKGNRKSTDTVGNTPAKYEAKKARRTGAEGRPIAIVVTANHAAQKDNMKNNTLLKALG